MTAVFITATGTDIGKTHVACALIRALRAQGRPVDAFKPVLSGYDVFEGSDAARLLAALGKTEADLDLMSPLRFAAPLAPPSAARAEGARLDLADLVARCRMRAASTEGLLLIEGAYVSGQLFGEGGPVAALPEVADRLIEASLGRK